jgi:hypothetical protein
MALVVLDRRDGTHRVRRRVDDVVAQSCLAPADNGDPSSTGLARTPPYRSGAERRAGTTGRGRSEAGGRGRAGSRSGEDVFDLQLVASARRVEGCWATCTTQCRARLWRVGRLTPKPEYNTVPPLMTYRSMPLKRELSIEEWEGLVREVRAGVETSDDGETLFEYAMTSL